ncbi:MAG: hypothetical protein JNN08_26695 [Bryobacterales bacterium]|nr:hypothetical protein [Bryobacterales bacterium]
MTLSFPKRLSDPEWKKAEKAHKIAATGVGETLPTAEKSVKALSDQLKLNKDHAKVIALAKTAVADCGASGTHLNKTASKYSTNKPAYDAILDFEHLMNRLASELESLTKLMPHDDIADKADRVADRVKSIIGA